MLKIDKPIIVEGKYDKIKLSAVVDAPIITTGGFSLFNNKEKIALIKKFAENGGVIVMTDSDGAGLVIRNFIKNISQNCDVVNVYIPQIEGKERRKSEPSKAGFLGVEGIDVKKLEEILKKFNLTSEKAENTRKVTKTDFYFDGLSGGENSQNLRNALSQVSDLPQNMSANALLEAVNLLFSYDIYKQLVNNM